MVFYEGRENVFHVQLKAFHSGVFSICFSLKWKFFRNWNFFLNGNEMKNEKIRKIGIKYDLKYLITCYRTGLTGSKCDILRSRDGLFQFENIFRFGNISRTKNIFIRRNCSLSASKLQKKTLVNPIPKERFSRFLPIDPKSSVSISSVLSVWFQISGFYCGSKF